MKRLLLAALIIAAALAVWPGRPWSRRPNPIPGFEALAAEVGAHVVPPAATGLRESEIQRGDMSLETHWQFETEQDWGAYCRWMREHLPGGFKAAPPATAPVSFIRTKPGDAHYLLIEMLSPGPPTRVRVTLRAVAD